MYPLPPLLGCCHNRHLRSNVKVYHLLWQSQRRSSRSLHVAALVAVSAPAVLWTSFGSASLVLLSGSPLVAWVC